LSPIWKEKGKHLINDCNILAIHSVQLQKEVKSNPKQPSCKKSVWAFVKKRCEIQDGSLDGMLMAKNIIMTIQLNLVPNPSESKKKIHLNLSLLKFLPLTYITAISWPLH